MSYLSGNDRRRSSDTSAVKKFNEGTFEEFDEWKDKFRSVCESNGCWKFFHYDLNSPVDQNNLAWLLEEEFPYQREVPIGQEANAVAAQVLLEVNGVTAMYNNLRAQAANVLGGVNLQRELLKYDTNQAEKILTIQQGEATRVEKMNERCRKWDKDVEVFNECKGKAISMIYEKCGERLQSLGYQFVSRGQVRNFWRTICEHFESLAGNIEHLIVLRAKMDNMKFSKHGGGITEHLAMLDRWNHVLRRTGTAADDPTITMYLLKAIERADEADKKPFKGIIDYLKSSRATRDTVVAELRSREMEARDKEDFKGKGKMHFVQVNANAADGKASKKRKHEDSSSSSSGNPVKKMKRICYKCESPDHWAKDCDMVVICSECKKDNHIAKYCYMKHPELMSPQFRKKWEEKKKTLNVSEKRVKNDA